MTSKKKSLKIALYLLLFTLIPLQSMAQETEDFSPDAPGATTGVSIMPQGKIDWETGIGLEWDRRNTRVRDKKRLEKVGNLVKNSYLYR